MGRAVEGEGAGLSEGQPPLLPRLDLSGIEALVFGGHRVWHLSPVGPHDGGSRRDFEACWLEGEILHRSVHGAARGGRVSANRRSRLRAGCAASEVPAQRDGNGELESIA